MMGGAPVYMAAKLLAKGCEIWSQISRSACQQWKFFNKRPLGFRKTYLYTFLSFISKVQVTLDPSTPCRLNRH